VNYAVKYDSCNCQFMHCFIVSTSFTEYTESINSTLSITLTESSVFWDIMLCSPYKVNLRFEGTAADFQWTIQCYIPEDRILHGHLCKNLKSCISRLLLLYRFVNPIKQMHSLCLHDSVQGPYRSQIHLDGASQCTWGTQYSTLQQHCILQHSAPQTSGLNYDKTKHTFRIKSQRSR
jgi:hypothetical protein